MSIKSTAKRFGEALKTRAEAAPDEILVAGVTIITTIVATAFKANSDLASAKSKRAYANLHSKNKKN